MCNPGAKYGYNGLNWRVWKQADTNPPINTALDEQRLMYYSADWQLLEERIDVEASFPTSSEAGTSADIDKHMQYTWGTRYIDDIAMRRLDANKNGSFTDSGDKIYYHCTDAMFSTVCVIGDVAGVTLERISYDPYGKARQFEPEDMDGDGDVDVADRNIVLANQGNVPAPGDVDRDGDVDLNDSVAVTAAMSGSFLRPGMLSKTDNVIGWDGYVFNAELAEGGMYTVRHRHYRPELGRWMERDPAHYANGQNLYEYSLSTPTRYGDPLGLWIPPHELKPGQVPGKNKPLPSNPPHKPNSNIIDFINEAGEWALRYLRENDRRNQVNSAMVFGTGCIDDGGIPIPIEIPPEYIRDMGIPVGPGVFPGPRTIQIHCICNPCDAVAIVQQQITRYEPMVEEYNRRKNGWFFHLWDERFEAKRACMLSQAFSDALGPFNKACEAFKKLSPEAQQAQVADCEKKRRDRFAPKPAPSPPAPSPGPSPALPGPSPPPIYYAGY